MFKLTLRDDAFKWFKPGGDMAISRPPYLGCDIVKSSGSLSPHTEDPASLGAPEYALFTSNLTSDLRGPVGDALARNSAALTFTPAFANNLKLKIQ